MKKSNTKAMTKQAPAMTPEGREKQMISLAVNLAEKQLLEGTASSQIITHYLKLATKKQEIELEKLKKETELLEAKTEAVKSSQRVEELYANALKAMRTYSGNGSDYDEEDLY